MNEQQMMEEIDRLARLCEAKDAEIRRLNKWADGFSDAQLKERQTGEMYQQELREKLSKAQAQIAMQAKALELALEYGVYPQGTGIIHQIREAIAATSETVAAWRAKETEPLHQQIETLSIERDDAREKCVYWMDRNRDEEQTSGELRKEIAPLHREVAMLTNLLTKCNLHSTEFAVQVRDALECTQATALAYEREVEAKHPDKLRMDWLVSQNVEVRKPMPHGSLALFTAQTITDEEDAEHLTSLREQVDTELRANKGEV